VQLLTSGFVARGVAAFNAQRAALAALEGQVTAQASVLSFNDAWLFILFAFVLVSPAILLLKRPGAAAKMPADAH
jgi:hypothetical protein